MVTFNNGTQVGNPGKTLHGPANAAKNGKNKDNRTLYILIVLACALVSAFTLYSYFNS